MQDQAAFPATKWRNWPYFMGKHYFMMGKPTGWVLYDCFFHCEGKIDPKHLIFCRRSIQNLAIFLGKIWQHYWPTPGDDGISWEASFAQVFFCVKCNDLIDSCLSLIDFLDVFPSSCHYMSLMSPWWFQSSLKCTTGRVDRKSHSRHQEAPILYDGNSWDINYLRATVAIQSVGRMTVSA